MSDTNNGNTIETTPTPRDALLEVWRAARDASIDEAHPAPIGSHEVNEIHERAESSALDTDRKVAFQTGLVTGADRARAKADQTRLRTCETIGRSQGSNAVNRLIRREERALLHSMGLCKASK